MAWQTTTETGRIYRIGRAADNTAAPTTKPVTGGNITWTATASGEAMEGWTVATFDFAEDDWSFEMLEGDPVAVKSPAADHRAALIHDVPYGLPASVTFTSYEVGEKVYDFMSNVSDTTGVFTFSDTFTRYAVIIEVQGLGIHYFPSCEIMAAPAGGGYKNTATQEVRLEIFAGSSVTAGYQWIQWQDT